MQLQNGLAPSVPYFSQNTATTGVNTHSAVQAKADRTSIPTLPIIHKNFREQITKARQSTTTTRRKIYLTARHKGIPEASQKPVVSCLAKQESQFILQSNICWGVTASGLTFGFLCLHVTTGTMKHNCSMLY